MSEDKWDSWKVMYGSTIGHSGHACGILRRLEDDNKMMFYSGGQSFYQNKYGGDSAVGSSHNSKMLNLDVPSGWEKCSGLNAIDGNPYNYFENINPYEGFIFSHFVSDLDIVWHIWNATSLTF